MESKESTDEEEENYTCECNWRSSHPWALPIPGSFILHPGTRSTHSDKQLRHTPSQSSLHSEGSSRPSFPVDQCECLEVLQREILVHQKISNEMPVFTSQILHNRSKLLEASVQLTKEVKKGDLDVIVQARVAAMVGLLNIFTDEKLKYSWTQASEIIARTLRHGTNHACHVREWVMAFLRWRDLPLHQLKWKRRIIIDDEDIAEEIKIKLKGKEREGFLKAEDVVDVVASLEMQAIFAQKGNSKATISVKTALRWLEKMGWTYRKLKHGMYFDGHERLDVVEYRKAFVERWMGHK